MSHSTPTPERQLLAHEAARLCNGMAEQAAKDYIMSNGFKWRIRRVDGVGMMGTCDMKADRINLTIVGGIITGASVG